MVRTIKLELSDEECEQLAEVAGKAGLSVAELLENFIGDLVGGAHSNGSDEQTCAEQWYERCWFGMFPEATLLRYLLEEYEMDTFCGALKGKEVIPQCIESTKKELIRSGEAELKEDLEEYQEDLEMAEETLDDIWRKFLSWTDKEEPDKAEEVKKVEQWQRELEKLKAEGRK